jgi:hypothetical protein
MMQLLSRLLDRLSEFLASRKGLLPIIGIVCVICNFFLIQFSGGWIASSNLLLHLGVIIAIIGFMLAWAL